MRRHYWTNTIFEAPPRSESRPSIFTLPNAVIASAAVLALAAGISAAGHTAPETAYPADVIKESANHAEQIGSLILASLVSPENS